jgi:large subunit ribosomal protein L24
MKIVKGDTVKILAGKDNGKTGKVEKVLAKENKVLVPGLNIYKRHLKKRDEKKPGGIIDIARPLPVANVALVCPSCHKPTRVGYLFDKNGGKLRICKSCQKIIKQK